MATEQAMAQAGLALLVIGLGANGIVTQANEGQAEGDPASAAQWFRIPESEFSKLPAAQQTINFTNLNHDLLAAAILHETNRRRQQQTLPPLQDDTKAREAAAMQAQVMAEKKFVGHDNPVVEARRTLPDRLKEVGIPSASAAENVALQFARRYESGKPFFTDQEQGRTVFRYSPGGPPIEMHTYLTFASALLDQWMNSPGHRSNILHRESRYLGCSGFPARNELGMEVLYCTQVFFAPAASP